MDNKHPYSAMHSSSFIPGLLCRARQRYRAKPHPIEAGAIVRFLGQETITTDKFTASNLYHFLDQDEVELVSRIQINHSLFDPLPPSPPEGAKPEVARLFADLWLPSADARALACIRLGDLGSKSRCVLRVLKDIALYDSGYSHDHTVIVRVAAAKAIQAIES